MQNIVIIVILTFFCQKTIAQNITFVYEVKSKPSTGKATEQKDIYYLDVLGLQSAFRSHKNRTSDSLVAHTGYGLGSNTDVFDQLYLKKNLANKEAGKIVTSPLSRDQFELTIDERLVWAIHAEKTTISQYACQKATVSYGGRSWTAWFTAEIPLQEGPYVFHGLPGLIVKISDDTASYDFTLVQVKTSNQNNMFALRKGHKISWADFNKLQLSYYKDPFSEIKMQNIPMKVVDENNNELKTTFKDMTSDIQNKMRSKDNPIELNHKLTFDR